MPARPSVKSASARARSASDGVWDGGGGTSVFVRGARGRRAVAEAVGGVASMATGGGTSMSAPAVVLPEHAVAPNANRPIAAVVVKRSARRGPEPVMERVTALLVPPAEPERKRRAGNDTERVGTVTSKGPREMGGLCCVGRGSYVHRMTATVVFIHGMFVTPKCWDGWVERFQARGYRCLAPAWPLHDRPIQEQRARHPDAELGALSIPALVEHFERIVKDVGEPPILVGHSMGGLLVQLLVQRGLARAGVAIDSAPPKGVASFKWSFLRSNWPVISPFVDKNQPFFMSLAQFVYTFVHTLPPEEQRAAYDAHVVPESRIVGRGTLSDAAKIDFQKPHAPLFFVAGELDRIIPASLNASNHARYKDAGSITDFKMFEGRTHYIIGQPGWEEVADEVDGWIRRVTATPR